METNNTENQKITFFKILLLTSIITFLIWVVGQNSDVYRYALVGVIFEILWLPMLAIILVIPLVSFYNWYKDKFKTTSRFLYLLLWSIFSVGIIYFLSKK